MPRIRAIKPDAFTSDTLSLTSLLARWTFAGLWTYCDDEGRARADVRLIKAALFPIDDATTLADIRGALDELEGISAICRYNVEDKTYMHVPKWDEHQKINRPTDSKLPPCPGHTGGVTADSEPSHETLTEDSVSPHGGKGKERNREQGSAHAQERVSDTRLFDQFWSAYPRKKDKAKSLKAWEKATKKHEPAKLIEAAKRYALEKRDTEQQFILLPSTWLNGERWDDEPDRPARPTLVTDPSQLPPVEQSWMARRPS